MGSRRRLAKLREEPQAFYRVSAESELLLLDTHIWIWYVRGDQSMTSSKVLSMIDRAKSDSLLRLSPISIWEIGMLESKKKIHIAMDCLDWVEQSIEQTKIILAPITPEIAVESTRLPGDFHGDPADRLIVATARYIGAVLITQDERMLKYGREHYVKVLKA